MCLPREKAERAIPKVLRICWCFQLKKESEPKQKLKKTPRLRMNENRAKHRGLFEWIKLLRFDVLNCFVIMGKCEALL
ncbi:hypothetical protein CEXT_310821 [Caerostris extrusa]|uniref:Uncharacterized protein n=1 Tax=Caerostris extrusa TaxID=172846 RepID=A0AAV4S6R2_CAEEX|nr:hypothetical protein CEXT_310821 [Caerostris extrusa]